MSNYHDYREVKVMIAHKLMDMDGWTVYGYHADKSDSMTDYWDPASWGGVAEKNGYVLCVGVHGASEAQEVRKYNYSTFSYDKNILDKISKLENMTIERGASESEVVSARKSIERLQKKAEDNTESNNKYVVIGTVPAHMAHPPKCNWHIEKDGLIIAKGNGLLKYNGVRNYFAFATYKESMQQFKEQTKENYIDQLTDDYMMKGYYPTREQAAKCAESHYIEMVEKSKLFDEFNKFMGKLDSACGCLVGEGDVQQYQKIIVTEYKNEMKAVETESGEVKEGQCFVLKSNFNFKRYKGYVYRIHQSIYNDKTYYHAYKLNGKLTKECTGNANTANHWSYVETEKFMEWINKGAISWCEIREVKTPYQVEKVVKIESEKSQKREKKESEQENTKNEYTIEEDIHTKTGEKLWVVKNKTRLSFGDFKEESKSMSENGGYYSKFKHGYIFKSDPASLFA